MWTSLFRCKSCDQVRIHTFKSHADYKLKESAEEIVCDECGSCDMVRQYSPVYLDSAGQPTRTGRDFCESQRVPFGNSMHEALGDDFTVAQAHKWAKEERNCIPVG